MRIFLTLVSGFFLISPILAEEAVVLIHGLGRRSTSMRTIRHCLQKEGYNVVSIDYKSKQQSIESSIQEVKRKLSLEDLTPYSKVHFVGHSLGGLIAISVANDKNVYTVGRVITLGTPFGGSKIAKELLEYQMTRKFYGPALADLGLNHIELPKKNIVKTDTIVGMNCPLHLRWFGNYLEQPHDCLVDEKEASYVGANLVIKLPVDHNSMLKDERVLEHILTSLRS